MGIHESALLRYEQQVDAQERYHEEVEKAAKALLNGDPVGSITHHSMMECIDYDNARLEAIVNALPYLLGTAKGGQYQIEAAQHVWAEVAREVADMAVTQGETA